VKENELTQENYAIFERLRLKEFTRRNKVGYYIWYTESTSSRSTRFSVTTDRGT